MERQITADKNTEIKFGIVDTTTIDTTKEFVKKAWLAKANIYTNDVESLVGRRIYMRRLNKENQLEDVTIPPIESVENVYGNIYKLETMNAIYIVEMNFRTEI